jgi:hypothetical protein
VKNLMRKVLTGILVVVFAAALFGCCFASGKRAIADAQAAVDQCKARGTITCAPYETASGIAYLGGAKEVWGDHDWCKAEAWANKSKTMSDAALAAPPCAVSPCLSMMD